MKLILGLGNPGPEYVKTRHNAGFMAIDRLAAKRAATETWKSRFGGLVVETLIGGVKTILLKPLTFMNRSGQSLVQAIAFYKLDAATEVLVLVDDVAIPTGSIRIRAAGSAGGHNGLADIQRALGSEFYPRLRIGIDAKPPVMALHDYVLGRFTDDQFTLLGPALERACDAAEVFITADVQTAMNRFNKKDEPPPPPSISPAASTPVTPTPTRPPTPDSRP